MTRKIDWTDEEKAQVRAMRLEQGLDCEQIGAFFGRSKNAVVNLLDRMRLPTGAVFRVARKPASTDAARGNEALPAGHPVTWGALFSHMGQGMAAI